MSESQPIPNIDIGQVYDTRYSEAEAHYDKLCNLAGFFGRNMSIHRHDRCFQVHYVKNGTVRVHLDDQQHVVSGPMFFLTPPTITHSFSTESNSEGHVLTVRQQLVWQLIDADSSIAPAGAQLPAACVVLANSGPELAGEVRRLEFLFEELSEEVGAERPGRSAVLNILTRLIMISVLRLCRNSVNAKPAKQEDLKIFHRFNELIEAHYQQHWPLSRYAQGIGVTEARLNDVCRRIAELPSKRLIMERLMQEAKRLLLFTGSSANEICYQLGFKDPAYFNRFFQRNLKMTPREYRQRQSGSH